jgi:hypothetical protein
MGMIQNEDFTEWSSDAPIEWIVQDDLSSLGDVSITAQGHSPKGRIWKIKHMWPSTRLFKLVAKPKPTEPVGHPWTTWLKHILFGLFRRLGKGER